MGVIIIMILIGIGSVIFSIYLLFKIIQFTIQAINYYKKILIREDVIIKLLVDIRDNTKLTPTDIDFDSDQNETGNFCPHCNKPDVFFDANGNLFCPHCKVVIDPAKILKAPAPPPGDLPEPTRKEPYPAASPNPFSEEHETKQEKGFCQHCGFKIKPGVKFCGQCGQTLP